MTNKRGRPAGARSAPADEQIRKDIFRVYKRLGGVKWLEAWVRADARNASEFVKQGLAKVLATPMLRAIEPPQEPPAKAQMSDFDAARHIAFVMNRALYEAGEPLTVEGEVVEPAPSWMPPADQEQPPVEPQQGAVEEQPALPAPEPVPKDRPERRSLADLLGVEPPPSVEPSLYGGFGQFHGSAEEQGGGRRDLIGDVRVVQRRETVAEKLRRQRGG